MNTDGLAAWYRDNGRHDLPWRLTTDVWAVLVSEVMLQQTPVARVLPRWQRFLDRWPSAAACAATGLDDVLREWQGLGYPRRAGALHATAVLVAAHGWPGDEAGLRALPGVGEYTARALLWLTALDPGCPPPRDINIGRVAARAGLNREAWQVPARALDTTVGAARPAALTPREYVLALFDVGARHCRATPDCSGCPMTRCASRQRVMNSPPPRAPRRQGRYVGSMRQLRGAVLAAILEGAGADLGVRVGTIPAAAEPGAVRRAVEGLVADGLVEADHVAATHSNANADAIATAAAAEPTTT